MLLFCSPECVDCVSGVGVADGWAGGVGVTFCVAGGRDICSHTSHFEELPRIKSSSVLGLARRDMLALVFLSDCSRSQLAA